MYFELDNPINPSLNRLTGTQKNEIRLNWDRIPWRLIDYFLIWVKLEFAITQSTFPSWNPNAETLSL